MSARKFKFISPGIFINEIDKSFTNRPSDAVGPAIVGLASKGPALRPIKVNNFQEFQEIFGRPSPGASSPDLWRDGTITAPTYGAYAAQAWLRNGSPLTFVRLLGATNLDANNDGGYAGWKTTNGENSATANSSGGAYGLWVIEGTGSVTTVTPGATRATEGTLAAVFYVQNGQIALSGTTLANTATTTASFGEWIKAVDSGPTFKAVISETTTSNEKIVASFNLGSPTDDRYIRKVFSTNPTLTNSDITTSDSLLNYWLGESFDGNLGTFKTGEGGLNTGISGSVPASCYGMICALGTPGNTINGGNFKKASTTSLVGSTGWFISQDVGGQFETYDPANMQKLFRLKARDTGEETQRKVKITIKDIRASTDPNNDYGSFTVAIRDIKDTDAAPIVLEQYNNCNLNPISDNYIAKKIGDKYLEWSYQDSRYREYGSYDNNSAFVRVEMQQDVAGGGVDPVYLPFGVFGPPRYKSWDLSGSIAVREGTTTELGTNGFVITGSASPYRKTPEEDTFVTGSTDGANIINGTFQFPKLRLRVSSSEQGVVEADDACFGVDTTYNSPVYNASVLDVLRAKADDIDSLVSDDTQTENSWVFSLDDVQNIAVTASTYADAYSSELGRAMYASGSRAAGKSYTAHTGSKDADVAGPSNVSYKNVLDYGFNQFTTCVHGGFDGVDITEKNPFNNTRALASTATVNSSAEYNAVDVALESLRDPEFVEYNVLAAPGITNTTINQKILDICEGRGDALGVIDLEGGYVPSYENTSAESSRLGSVSATLTEINTNLRPNTSYGCTYYPWVQIRDNINGSTVWAPPSIVAIGAMAYGQRTSQLWFAPAGFTRGGLSANNAAGLPVVGVREKLTSKQRDKLYENNINPIASFPAEGIVIFGQKTLQMSPSALDRINVRRLLLFLKKQISTYAATIMFDQNVRQTWARFTGLVEPFLASVKAGLGITEYKLVLDETTTTPDLIDRNVMYAKIFIKPARAIEYIAIDFIITDSGASFED